MLWTIRLNIPTLALAVTLAFACLFPCSDDAVATVAGEVADAKAGTSISPAERKVLDELLGKGVVGATASAATIKKAEDWFPLAARATAFTTTYGRNKGKKEMVTFAAKADEEAASTWRMEVGDEKVAFLRKGKDGILQVSLLNPAKGTLTQFKPSNLWVLDDTKPGATRQSRCNVKVVDASHPDHVQHEGKLDSTYTHLGTYEVTVPAGVFSAVLLKHTMTGKVGQAKVNNVHYQLLAKNVGVIAACGTEDIASGVFYHKKSKTGRVLASR